MTRKKLSELKQSKTLPRTIRGLAQGINCFSECSGQILDKAFESKEYETLAKKPVSAISGMSDEDAALFKRAFGIDNIKELAENKYVLMA